MPGSLLDHFPIFQDPIFQVFLTDFPIFQVKFEKFPGSKKGLVLSHFLYFQFFKCSNHKVTQGPSNGTCQKISNFSSFAHRFSNFSSQIQNSSLLKKGTSGQPHFSFPFFMLYSFFLYKRVMDVHMYILSDFVTS